MEQGKSTKDAKGKTQEGKTPSRLTHIEQIALYELAK